MLPEDTIAGLFTATGAIAELLGVYRNQLVKNGFTVSDANIMCMSLQDSIIQSAIKEKEE